MATKAEFEAAFAAIELPGNITVQSRSGKRYWIHSDQLVFVPDGLLYGIPHKKHPRARGVAGEVVWLRPENVSIVEGVP